MQKRVSKMRIHNKFLNSQENIVPRPGTLAKPLYIWFTPFPTAPQRTHSQCLLNKLYIKSARSAGHAGENRNTQLLFFLFTLLQGDCVTPGSWSSCWTLGYQSGARCIDRSKTVPLLFESLHEQLSLRRTVFSKKILLVSPDPLMKLYKLPGLSSWPTLQNTGQGKHCIFENLHFLKNTHVRPFPDLHRYFI